MLHNARLVAERETLREALEAAEEERRRSASASWSSEVSRAERVGAERALAVAADEAAVSAQQATEMAEHSARRSPSWTCERPRRRRDRRARRPPRRRDREGGARRRNGQDENASALLDRVEGMREAAHEAVRRAVKQTRSSTSRRCAWASTRAAEEARRARERAEEAAAAARKTPASSETSPRERAARRAASPYRDVARRLARGVAEAVEFGLGAAAVDLPTAPPSAGSPEVDANAAFWYDAERDEIFLAEISLEANERERRREGPGGTAEGRREG